MSANDSTCTIKDLKAHAKKLITDRAWEKYHSPKNLSMQLSIEAGELMEKFLWLTTQESFDALDKNRQDIEDEAADVLLSLLNFCNAANIDVSSAFLRKLEKIKLKYPIEMYKGKHTI